MAYDRREIMTRAWELYRIYTHDGVAIEFSRALKMAWHEVKTIELNTQRKKLQWQRRSELFRQELAELAMENA